VAVVRIRRVDDWVIAFHKRRAVTAGHSLEEELRSVLTEAALSDRRKFANQIRRRLARQRAKYGVLPDSGPGIRAEREGKDE
jgi:plasmid stability protein